MKKILLSLIAIAMLLTFTSCEQKEVEIPVITEITDEEFSKIFMDFTLIQTHAISHSNTAYDSIAPYEIMKKNKNVTKIESGNGKSVVINNCTSDIIASEEITITCDFLFNEASDGSFRNFDFKKYDLKIVNQDADGNETVTLDASIKGIIEFSNDTSKVSFVYKNVKCYVNDSRKPHTNVDAEIDGTLTMDTSGSHFKGMYNGKKYDVEYQPVVPTP